jgi:hypothetical protein
MSVGGYLVCVFQPSHATVTHALQRRPIKSKISTGSAGKDRFIHLIVGAVCILGLYQALENRRNGVAQTRRGTYVLYGGLPLTSSGEVGRWADALQVDLSPHEPSKIR